MARASKTDFYQNFRFYVEMDGTPFPRGLSLVQSTADGLILGAGHAEGEDTLCQMVSKVIYCGRPPRRLSVWIFNPRTKRARNFSIIFKGATPLPIDLNAMDSGIALDRVLLTDVTYETIRDVEEKNWPAALRGAQEERDPELA